MRLWNAHTAECINVHNFGKTLQTCCTVVSIQAVHDCFLPSVMAEVRAPHHMNIPVAGPQCLSMCHQTVVSNITLCQSTDCVYLRSMCWVLVLTLPLLRVQFPVPGQGLVLSFHLLEKRLSFSCRTGRPIASLAFHIEGDALAVASGHKLYMWQYTKQHQGEEGAPPVALKTRRSLRAVHFHPLGLPLVLTAEVNDASPPVTLPFGVSATPPSMSPPPPPPPIPGHSLHAYLPPPRWAARQVASDVSGVTYDHARLEAQHGDWPRERRAPRRLSEVFRALMEEEREEELLAQLESSASLQAAQASASRQILGLTSSSHAQLHRPQGPRSSSPALSLRTSGGVGSLPHPPVPIRQLRPPSRPRSYHPLRHSIEADSAVSHHCIIKSSCGMLLTQHMVPCMMCHKYTAYTRKSLLEAEYCPFLGSVNLHMTSSGLPQLRDLQLLRHTLWLSLQHFPQGSFCIGMLRQCAWHA